MTYSEKLRDPRWQKLRLAVMGRAGFACEDCGDTKRSQHVHHRIYAPGRDPWDYPIENFVCVCDSCHRIREVVVQRSRMVFQIITPSLANAFLDAVSVRRSDMLGTFWELVWYLAAKNTLPEGYSTYENGDGI